MDAKLSEMTVAAFNNVEDIEVELLRRLDAAKTKEEQEKLSEVFEAASEAAAALKDLRILVKKNF